MTRTTNSFGNSRGSVSDAICAKSDLAASMDHHLVCGDSLFGSWVRSGTERAESYGSPLLLRGPITKATSAAVGMQVIEGLTDAEIAEARQTSRRWMWRRRPKIRPNV